MPRQTGMIQQGPCFLQDIAVERLWITREVRLQQRVDHLQQTVDLVAFSAIKPPLSDAKVFFSPFCQPIERFLRSVFEITLPPRKQGDDQRVAWGDPRSAPCRPALRHRDLKVLAPKPARMPIVGGQRQRRLAGGGPSFARWACVCRGDRTDRKKCRGGGPHRQRNARNGGNNTEISDQ